MDILGLEVRSGSLDWELGGMEVGIWDLGGENRRLRWEVWDWEQHWGLEVDISLGEPKGLEWELEVGGMGIGGIRVGAER